MKRAVQKQYVHSDSMELHKRATRIQSPIYITKVCAVAVRYMRSVQKTSSHVMQKRDIY